MSPGLAQSCLAQDHFRAELWQRAMQRMEILPTELNTITWLRSENLPIYRDSVSKTLVNLPNFYHFLGGIN